ncbi:uncharacterized protein LOC136035389 isoform X3 [Artemia franciscana]|uniref:uncharacterized protein LOC136035389 isoform X3 n=1 Tax=Artemia franciscana TaxID=6661 RepID=UPI0032DB8112
MITFSERFIFVQENSNLIINVHRINGHDGDVSVRCRSLQQTAESGTDFLGGEQILSFHDQVGKISVPIQIMMTERNFNRVFEIELSEPGGGATIGPIPRMAVSIKHDDAFTELMKNRIPTSTYLREFRMHNKSFFSRIRDAVIVNDGDAKNATAFDWCIHVFAVVWKVEVWEGLVTVLLFPLLVISAYLTEKRGCPCLNQTKTKTLNQNGNQIIDEPSLQQSEPGMITFSERFIFVQENSNLIINVHRINGHDGDVSVRCRSLQQTAESGTDFLGGEQILSFHDQVVEVWEGLVTVLLFPLLVISAYLTEKRGCPCLNQTKTKTLNQNGNQIIDEPSLQQSEPGMITFSERFIFVQENSNLIINVHRINGHDGDVSVRCRSLQQTAESGTDFLGGEQILSFHDQVVEVWEGLVTVLLFPLLVISAYLTEKRGCPCLNQTKTKTLNQNGNQIIDEPSLQQSEPGMITFSERFIFVQENSNLIINVHRINGHDGDVSVRCRSLQQTAESGTDFLGGEQILSFHDQVVEVWEGLVTVLLFPLLVISAYLTEKRGCPCLNQTKTKTLNQNGNQIIDEPSLQQSEPGMITFSERFIFVQENSNLIINVHRINGHDGDVSVRCRSLQQTAESGTDFLGGEQILSFHDQVVKDEYSTDIDLGRGGWGKMVQQKAETS